MNRLKIALFISFVTLCFSISSVFAKPTVIRLAHPNVPAHPMGQAFEKFKELLEERTNGAFRVIIFDSSKFGNFDSVVMGLQLNMLQMGSASTANLSPFSNEFLAFDLPFLFPDYPSTDLITDGPIGQRAAKALERTGIVGLGYIEIGFRNIWNNRRDVITLEDLRGLKIRSTASKPHIDTLSSLGMNPTPVAWGEVYTAMQQKTVDGIDIDLNLAWYNNFPEVNKYVTIVNSIFSPHLVMVSKRFLDSLSEEHRKIFMDTFDEVKFYQRKLIREGEVKIITELEKANVKVTVLSEQERARWAKAVQPVYDDFEKRFGTELIEEIRTTLSEAQK